MTLRPRHAPDWVLDRYELVQHVGRGTWADVYKALDNRGQAFAVKILKPEYQGAPRTRTRFLTEAKAMARLAHPHIIRIFDVGGALGDDPAIVMEYAAGGDLRAWVPSGGIEPPRAAVLAMQVLHGLVEAHAAGIVHRGISPSSILLDDQGRAKVSDFGVARITHDDKDIETQSAESLGDWFYTSPEQRRDPRAADERSDLYSVGAVLVFMLTGRDPRGLFIQGLAGGDDESLHPALEPVVHKAVAERPGDRYQTAAEMGRALRGLFG